MRSLHFKLVFAVLAASSCASIHHALPDQALPEAGQGIAQKENDASALIRRGRVLLDDGKALEAEELFKQAGELDVGSFESRLWVLRAWMDQGRNNDTMDGIDALRDSGRVGVEMDYLYGMAFVRRAEKMIAEGNAASAATAEINSSIAGNIAMNITSGFELLSKALPQAERRFRDGWVSLARAGWHHAGDRANNEDFEGARQARAVARDAADRAVAFYPHHADVRLMHGQVAISQFVSALPPDASSPADWGDAAPHWEAAARSFRAALELVDPTPEDITRQMLAATAGMQLGNTLVWKGEREKAAHAFARGISWAPWGMNFQTIYNTLYDGEAEAPLGFVLLALREGQASFERHFGGDSTADATTLWWLGWAQLSAGNQDEAAAAAFERVLAKWPAYNDAWYYLSQARYRLQDWEAAFGALAEGWGVNPTKMLELMQADDRTANVARVEYLKGKAFGSQRLEEAVALANLVAETEQNNFVLWCDLGLFLRERGNQLREDPQAEEKAAALADLDQRAWEAYSRALLLAPDNPQVLNDAAVILQYYLKRDLKVALSMYLAAQRLAKAGLDSSDLDDAQREVFATALQNARDNAAELTAQGDSGETIR